MTETLIPILNTRLLTTNFFSERFGLCELITNEKGTRPMQYVSNGNSVPISDFDKYNGVSYWRKTGAISSQDLDSGLVSANKYVRLTIPLRLVAVVSRQKMSADDAYNGERLASDLFKVLNSNLNGTVRQTLGARQIGVVIESIEDNRDDIMNVERPESKKLDSGKFVICAINLNILVDIQQKCIDSSCNILTDCEALLAALSAFQKNTCILPSYDFSDATVNENLTNTQRTALIELLCGESCDGDIIVNLDGVLLTTLTTPDYSTETINITW